jgi:heme o synthase
MFLRYIWLTKPGIIIGNLITAAGGFLFASRGDVSFGLLLATLVGIALVIASGCVANNYTDRHIDAKMTRTKWRATANGKVSGPQALAFAALLGAAGFAILILFTNSLTVGAGLLGLFFYLVMYGIWKRRSPFGTVVGSVAGATPILAGYLAVSGRIDPAAIILFLIMALWQMPHFYAIAMYRSKDYAAASIPVLPVKKSPGLAKQYIVIYICLFIAALCSLTALGYAGFTYLAVTTALGFIWLLKGMNGLRTTNDSSWARAMFRFSLRVVTVFALMISIDHWLP